MYELENFTTHTTSSMVMLVSAMLVAMTILRTPGGGLLNTSCWLADGIMLWRGMMRYLRLRNIGRSSNLSFPSTAHVRVPGAEKVRLERRGATNTSCRHAHALNNALEHTQ